MGSMIQKNFFKNLLNAIFQNQVNWFMRNVILYQLELNLAHFLDLNDSMYQLYATSFTLYMHSGKKAMGSMSQQIFLISYGESVNINH